MVVFLHTIKTVKMLFFVAFHNDEKYALLVK